MNPTAMASTTKTASIATAFTRKLYRMLDIEDPVVIGWDVSGLSFSIRDEEQLDENILPRYFRGRVDVFRQHLGEHGFRRATSSDGHNQVETFTHKNFVRGEPNRLNLIVRVSTNKRRRSRMGKKRAPLGVPPQSSTKEPQTPISSTVDADDFDLDTFLLESTTIVDQPEPVDEDNQASASHELQDSLARILAFHATNPVVSSTVMLDQDSGRLAAVSQVETPIFSFDMMASMVEWLNTSA